MSSVDDIYTCTPREIRALLLDIFYAGLVPFVRSSPGMGKSSIFGSIARELNLWMIDHRLSTSDPTDMSGLPNFQDGFARFAPFEELFPIETTPIPKGKDGWMIFLDEFNAATKLVQAASYKLILDKMIGQHKLHPHAIIGMAGNLDTDRSITNMISTAMQSRVVHLQMRIAFNEWLEDVALKEGYDSRIIAFLSQYESKLMDFRPDHNERTFCCPRTWEFVNKLVKGRVVTDGTTKLLAGTITSGIAAEFVQFCQIFGELINIKEILADPKTCRIPDKNDLKWATIAHMMEKVDEKNFTDLAAYANRYSLDFRILFFRSTLVQHPKLRQHPAFATAMVELSRYLNG